MSRSGARSPRRRRIRDGTPPASPARRALCHLCWRWETVSHAAALSVLERLDKAEHVEDVAAALRVCEALLRVEDALAPTRCGFVLEGRAFRHPHALAAEPRADADADADADAGADAEAGSEPPPGAVPPHLRVALSAAGDRRPEDFPSGVIEQAAFEVCAAPKRLLIARFLVRLAEEDAGAGGAGARGGGARSAARGFRVRRRRARRRGGGPGPRHSAAGGGGGAARGHTRLRGGRDLRRALRRDAGRPVDGSRARRGRAGARAGGGRFLMF